MLIFHFINWVFDEINIDLYSEIFSLDAEQFLSYVFGAAYETWITDAILNTLASRGFCV